MYLLYIDPYLASLLQIFLITGCIYWPSATTQESASYSDKQNWHEFPISSKDKIQCRSLGQGTCTQQIKANNMHYHKWGAAIFAQLHLK